MAIETSNLNLFPPQLITNRDFIKTNGGNENLNNTQMGSESLLLFQQSLGFDSIIPANNSTIKADSGISYNFPVPKKRSRDSLIQSNSFMVPQRNNLSQFSPCFSEDIPFQIQQQQSEIDYMVAEHTKKIKLGVEERQKERARLILSAVGMGMRAKLREKEEQIVRMVKLNWVLQERVKNLYMENQVWRDLAHTSEATADSLRSNLEQVLLAQVSDERVSGNGGAAAGLDDAESCCDNGTGCGFDTVVDEEVERRTLARGGGVGEGVKDKEVVVGGGGGANCVNKMCRKCGERESSVLLLPCRHLCLCTMCGSTLIHTCPVCNSSMNASLHVNMS